MTAESPLTGVRVLELGELIAGPFVGTLLSEFGADVIKVERPGGGDVLRQFGPIIEGESIYWAVNSRNKRSISLDLSMDAGRAVLRDLIRECDVLIASLRPGTLESWGFDQSVLTELNRQLVVVYASAFGRDGPYAMKGGYDPVAQGFSGLSFVTGERQGAPMRAGGAIPVCDFMTGLLGALGVALSLYNRDARGADGCQIVDVALYDMAFRMLAPLLTYFDLTGVAWQRDGNHSLGGAPTGHFATKDGKWVCVSVQNNEQFARCARLVERPEWQSDPRFRNLASRTQHREEIETVVAAWIAERDRDLVVEAFERVGLVIGKINSVADMAGDPHLIARSIATQDSRTLGSIRVPRPVPQLSGNGRRAVTEAPALGEHTREILKTVLDYDQAKIAELFAGGVVAGSDALR